MLDGVCKFGTFDLRSSGGALWFWQLLSQSDDLLIAAVFVHIDCYSHTVLVWEFALWSDILRILNQILYSIHESRLFLFKFSYPGNISYYLMFNNLNHFCVGHLSVSSMEQEHMTFQHTNKKCFCLIGKLFLCTIFLQFFLNEINFMRND